MKGPPRSDRADRALRIGAPGSDQAGWAAHRWHSLGAKEYPLSADLFGDLPRLIREYVVTGHAPVHPLLKAEDSVLTLGSCFAREFRRYLEKGGFAAADVWIPSGLNNTFAIVDFLSWCTTGRQSARGFGYDRVEGGEIREWTPETQREEALAHFARAGAFVFTLGLAEVWEDRQTGGIFWQGVPESIFEAGRHRFRLTTVEENEQNILRIIEMLRRVNARAPLILTLSPVPLKATFRDMSCMTADCVSKSTLRVAIDRALTPRPEGVYYWPSFEIVRWAGAHLPWAAYGLDDNRSRHVSSRLVAHIIDAFVEAFYAAESVEALRAAAR